HLALALRLVDAERVGLDLRVARVLEAALRRDRNPHLVGGDEDRLAELPVPGAILLLDALEGGELKLRAMDEGRDLGGSTAGVAAHSLAEGARSDLGLIVDRQHQTLEVLLKIIVGLGRAPFLVACAPG